MQFDPSLPINLGNRGEVREVRVTLRWDQKVQVVMVVGSPSFPPLSSSLVLNGGLPPLTNFLSQRNPPMHPLTRPWNASSGLEVFAMLANLVDNQAVFQAALSFAL